MENKFADGGQAFVKVLIYPCITVIIGEALRTLPAMTISVPLRLFDSRRNKTCQKPNSRPLARYFLMTSSSRCNVYGSQGP